MRAKGQNILFFGDVCGKIGRKALKKALPKIRKETQADLVIANADNLAHGKGVTAETLNELLKAGVDFFTSGDHAFDRVGSIKESYESDLPIIRPLNFSPKAPGDGYKIIASGGKQILVVNLIGRVFMKQDFECPFEAIEDIFKKFEKSDFSAIIIDIHAEATSEKLAIRHYLDGKVSAVIGTHTHVATADYQVSKKGTAYITDAGMTGAEDGILGVEKSQVLDTFLTQIKHSFVIPEKGWAVLNGVFIRIGADNKKSISINPIYQRVKIN